MCNFRLNLYIYGVLKENNSENRCGRVGEMEGKAISEYERWGEREMGRKGEREMGRKGEIHSSGGTQYW